MSFWQFLGNIAVSDQSKTVQRVSENTSVSSDGTVYTRMGNVTTGSDGCTRLSGGATGIGAFFNDHSQLSSDWSSASDLEEDQF